MSDAKWTPGPWVVEEGTSLVWGDCRVEDDGTVDRMGVPVATAHGNPHWARHGETLISESAMNANAALIAAAPALYEALETTAGNIRSLGPAGALGPYEVYRPWLELVEAALAAARSNKEG